MNNLVTTKIASFLLLLLAQGLVLNHINFLGYINPFIYVLFILTYPTSNNRVLFLFLSFLLGLCVDVFSDSGGVHAAASVFLAYARPPILKFSFGMLYDHQGIKFNQSEFGSFITYVTFGVVTHHLVLFSLEFFNFSEIVEILKKVVFSSIFTIIVCLITNIIFSRKRR